VFEDSEHPRWSKLRAPNVVPWTLWPRTATIACANGAVVARSELRSIMRAFTAQNKRLLGVAGVAQRRQVLHAGRRNLCLAASAYTLSGGSRSAACRWPDHFSSFR